MAGCTEHSALETTISRRHHHHQDVIDNMFYTQRVADAHHVRAAEPVTVTTITTCDARWLSWICVCRKINEENRFDHVIMDLDFI